MTSDSGETSASATSPELNQPQSNTKAPKKRASKACEHCRTRRTKCSGETPSCARCIADGLPDCSYRLKSRPGRHPRMHPARAGGSPSTPTTGLPLVLGLRAVEEDLERLYEAKTGARLSLRLPDLDTHHSLSPDTPLPPLPSVSHAETNTFIDAFKTQVHVVFSFVSPERISQLAKRYQELPGSLGDDQLALLYAVFAMGSYRLQTYVGQRLDPSAPRPDVAYFRHALEKLGTAATVTALNALICLTLYAMSTSSVVSSRSLIGKMVYVAQELGLHRKYTALAYPTETGARPLLFYTILIDTYHAGLVGERPLLHSFDTSLLLDAESTPSNEGTASPIITHLVLLQHAYLMEAYSGSKDPRAPLTVLNAEAKLIQFRGQLGDASSMASSLATTHYHWIRILIRAPCATDPLLGLSSLPVMLSSARTIVQNYQTLFNTQRYIWPILALARVVGSGNCIVQAFARGELPQREAEELVAVVLSLLNNFEKRLPVAATSYNNFCILASAFGLNVTAAASPGWTGDLFTTDTFPTSIPSDFGAFSFDPAFDTMMNPLWTLSQMEEVWGGQVGALPAPSPAF